MNRYRNDKHNMRYVKNYKHTVTPLYGLSYNDSDKGLYSFRLFQNCTLFKIFI